jgi:hypothetical protein
MEKEFVPYEEALALKELGFDELCFGYYGVKKVLNIEISYNLDHNLTRRNFIAASTFSQAFRWFRENYHIIGEVKFKGGKTTKTAWYDYIIYSEIDWNDENPNEQWKKHEEAELECLKKLIEIVKNK